MTMVTATRLSEQSLVIDTVNRKEFNMVSPSLLPVEYKRNALRTGIMFVWVVIVRPRIKELRTKMFVADIQYILQIDQR